MSWSTFLGAQEAGTSASVVLEDESSIIIDGELDDWVNVPAIVTVGGPSPSEDPGTNGRLRWQVSADANTIYFAATITDATIIAGQNDGAFWMEDSLELYLNLSDNLAATTYETGISQIRISAVDIGETDPNALTLTGIGLDDLDITGIVFATDDGWGTELAIDTTGLFTPVAGERFGLQIQANGSSGEGRDLKLSWSGADVEDTSFEDPSVFAQGVFVGAPVLFEGTVDEAGGEVGAEEGSPETVGVADGAIGGAQEVDSIVEGGPAIVTADEQRRSLLFAAVASSIAVFAGGLWFERKRRADEARHAAKRVVTSSNPQAPADSAGASESMDDSDPDKVDKEEFEAMLESILDDNAPTDGYEK